MKRQTALRGLAARLAYLLPERSRTALVAKSCARRVEGLTIAFPPDFSSVKNVLIVLPEDTVESFHQTLNVVGLLTLFKNAAITFFCERGASAFFKSMVGVSSIIEYDRRDRYLFSRSFSRYSLALAAGRFDVCIVLEKKPDLAMLRLVALTGARYRIGYDAALGYPFLNLRVRTAGRGRYLSDVNRVLGDFLGVPAMRPVRWVVPAQAQQEIQHALREHNVDRSRPLVGIDGHLFRDLFGPQWTASLLAALRSSLQATFYAVTDHASDPGQSLWLEQHGIAVIPAGTMSRLAALVQLSILLVTGNSLIFQLAQLLRKPAVGLFEVDTMEMYFKAGPNLSGIGYRGTPDDGCITTICDRAMAAARVPARAPDVSLA